MKLNKSQTDTKTVIFVPSKSVSVDQDRAAIEETEITAQLSVPTEGGWGWMVLLASFCALFILDGVAFTFGGLLKYISKDFKVADSLTALVNSTQISLYFLVSPLASALINRFGFKKVTMIGAISCCIGLFASYFIHNFVMLLICYGVVTGFGCSLVSMATTLIVGFYFVKLRALAMSIVVSGTSFGIMAMYPINIRFVERAGWRTVVLFHSGLHGFIFFLSFIFRPTSLLTLSTEDTRTITILPSQRLFNAVPSTILPIAAAVVQKTQSRLQSGVSSSASRISVERSPSNRGQLQQLHTSASQYSKSNVRDSTATNVEVKVLLQPTTSDTSVARPLYRDDVFYHGNVAHLPEYQRSLRADESKRTGLEYSLAVTRATPVMDLRERRRFWSSAVCRVLATMLDPQLLKRCSFLLLCFSGFVAYLGLLVPYVFLHDRNKTAGVESAYCDYLVSALSLANTFGRLILSTIALKIDPLKLYSFSLIIAGVSTMLSSLSYTIVYQYMYSIIFGFAIAGISCLRSVVIVSLFGLEKLTNATGMVIMFLGIGNIFSTPLAGVLKCKFGYEVSFYVSGFFITLGGLVSLPIKTLSVKEQTSLRT